MGVRHVLDDFRRKHGIDLSGDPVAMQRVRDLAERTKIDLSSRTEAPFSIPFITMTPQGQPLNLEMSFDRKLLESLTQQLVDRALKIVGAVMVDALLDEQQVVVKSIETNYRRVEGSAGATILGDGRVALILDLPELFMMHRQL